MSAFQCIQYDDRVEMVADGAVTSSGGLLLGTKAKIIVAPALPLAVTGVGRCSTVESLTARIMAAAGCGTVDGAIRLLEAELPTCDELSAPGQFTVVIAAFSESTGPGIWTFGNAPESTIGIAIPPPVLRYRFRSAASGPGLSFEEMEALGVSFIDGLEVPGPLLMEAQRRKIYPGDDDAAPGFYIGGHVDHAVIDADGVRVTRLLEWPDVVGRKIEPCLGQR